MDHSTTGDGLISALLVLAHLAESGRTLSELRAMRRVPQVLENVRVKTRVPLAEMPDVQRIIADAEKRLAGTGRLLVRYSGTEMLARVMVEGEDGAQIKMLAQEIGAAIQKYAGAPRDRHFRFARLTLAGFEPSAFRYAFTVRVRPM